MEFTSETEPIHLVKVVCVSDTHGLHRSILSVPEGDILIHAGDFSNTGEMDQIEDFMLWMAEQPHRYKIIIAGNHDITIDERYYEPFGRNRFHRGRGYDPTACRALLTSNTDVIYLEDSGTTLHFTLPDASVREIKVWGSPWQPEFCEWAFNIIREQDLLAKWQLIPSDSDIVITHGPPYGQLDMCFHGDRAGCNQLTKELRDRVQPQLHVFGHIHEGYGTAVEGGTTYVNACICTGKYDPTNLPIVVSIPLKGSA